MQAFLALLGACTERNPTYCDEAVGCAVGYLCSLEINTCVGDADPPKLAGTTPAEGADEVSVASSVVLVFSEPVDPSTVTEETVQLLLDDTPVAFGVATEGSTATLDPVSPLQPGVMYKVEVSAGVRDLAGNPLASAATLEFRTSQGPAVVEVRPAPGAEDVAAFVEIVVDLSEPIDPATVTGETLGLYRGERPLPGKVSAGRAAVRFTPEEPLSPATEYTAKHVLGLQDLDGHASTEGRVWTFTTAPRPALKLAEPRAGASGVPHDALIRLHFDRSLATESITDQSLRVVAGGAAVSGTVKLSASGDTLVFEPAQPLGHNVTYTVALDAQIRSQAGMALGPLEPWTFVSLDTEGPQVESTAPADGASDAELDTIRVTFSEPIDPAKVNEYRVRVQQVTATQPRAPEPGSLRVDGNTLVFEAAAPLILNADYEVQVDAISDMSANPMAAPFSFGFRTRAGQWRSERIEPRTTGADMTDPVLSLDNQGNALVAWSESETEGRGVVVAARAPLRQPWDSAGYRRVDEHSSGFAWPTCLAGTRDGRAVLAWRHRPRSSGSPTHYPYYARVIDAGGEWLGGVQPVPYSDDMVWKDLSCWATAQFSGLVFGASSDLSLEPAERQSWAALREHGDSGWNDLLTQVGAALPGSPNSAVVSQFHSVTARNGGRQSLFVWQREYDQPPERLRRSLHSMFYDPLGRVYSLELSPDGVESVLAADMHDGGDAVVLWTEREDLFQPENELRLRYFDAANEVWRPVESPARAPWPNPPFEKARIRNGAALLLPSGDVIVAWVAVRPYPDLEESLFVARRSEGKWSRLRELASGRLSADGVRLLQDWAGNAWVFWGRSLNPLSGYLIRHVRLENGRLDNVKVETVVKEDLDCRSYPLRAAMSERGNAMLLYSVRSWDTDQKSCHVAGGSRLMVQRYE